jgi:hypothetical protein
VEFWDLLELPEIPVQPDDLSHQITQADRIDLLAYDHYQDPSLAWVIAVANGMEELPTDFNVGDEIRIPSPRFVKQELFKKAKVQRRG